MTDKQKNSLGRKADDDGIAAELSHFLGFSVDHHVYAMPFAQVERVLRMTAVTEVPEEPSWLVGAISMSGTIIPVVSLRLRLRREPKSICLTDRIVVVRAIDGLKAMIVDETTGLIHVPAKEIDASPVPLPESPFLSCVITKEEEVIPVLDATKLVDTELDTMVVSGADGGRQ